LLVILFLQSLLIGLSIAAPVGPIGILCIRRTLVDGRKAGFIAGLGAATADAFYGAIAAFGLTIIASFLVNQSFWLRSVGGLFLVYLGVKTFIASSKEYQIAQNSHQDQPSMLNNYLSTFFLTISNPLTILSFAAIFAGFGSTTIQSKDYCAASAMVVGVFLGSTTWWFALSYLTSQFQDRLTSKSMTWINRIAGIIICAFGVAALISLIPYRIN